MHKIYLFNTIKIATMSRIGLFILILIIFASCNSNRETGVEKIDITPTTLINELEIALPGEFIIIDTTAIISKVRSNDNLMNVYGLNSMQLRGELCNIGKAGNELIQAILLINSDTSFSAYDLNDKYITYSTKDLSIVDIKNGIGADYEQRHFIAANSFIEINRESNSDSLFIYNHNGEEYLFGKVPIEGKFDNIAELRTGRITFKQQDSTLHYLSTKLPYVSKYKLTANKFSLKSERFYGKYSVDTKDGNGVVTNDARMRGSFCFTKDYIVYLRHSDEDYEIYKNSQTDKPNFSIQPKHLFVYDYDMNLKKIVNLGVNTLRLAAEGEKSNTIYLICSNDGLHNISKIEL